MPGPLSEEKEELMSQDQKSNGAYKGQSNEWVCGGFLRGRMDVSPRDPAGRVTNAGTVQGEKIARFLEWNEGFVSAGSPWLELG